MKKNIIYLIVKHIFVFTLFLTFLQFFLMLIYLPYISHSLGMSFAIPFEKLIKVAWPTLLICTSVLLISISFKQAISAPKYPLLTGFFIILIYEMQAFWLLKNISFVLYLVCFVSFMLTTLIAIKFKKACGHQILDKTNEKVSFYPLSILKLSLMYIFSFSLYRYYWWYQQWSALRKEKSVVILRSIAPIFFYADFLDTLNKQDKAAGGTGVKFSNQLLGYYICLIFITVFSVQFLWLLDGTPEAKQLLAKIISLSITMLSLFLYLLPQLTINRLNHSANIDKKITFNTLIFICLIFPIFSAPFLEVATFDLRLQETNAKILYEYAEYRRAYDKAFTLAENNNTYGKYLLGTMIYNGRAGYQDTEKAKEWLEDAAKEGNADAQYALGEIFWKEKDYKKSAFWYQKAVDLGHAYAANNLAILYNKGLGVKKNEQKVLALYLFAAEKGDHLAMYNLGDHYTKLAEPNYVLASQWFEKSINTQPNFCALHDLGVLYAAGKGKSQNKSIAMALLNQAAENLLIEHPEVLLKNKTLLKDSSINTDEIQSYFAYDQYNKAINKDNRVVLEKQYPEYTVKTAKAMLEKIKTDCWG